MSWRWGIASLLAAGAQAFGPIRWAGIPAGRFFLAPTPRAFPSRATVLPQKLTISDSANTVFFFPPNQIVLPKPDFHFSANLDSTITWDKLCVEAAIAKAVRINQCNGGATQMWDWVPRDRAGDYQIELQGTQQCLEVVAGDGPLHESTVELRACADDLAQTWKIEESTPHPTKDRWQSLPVPPLPRSLMLSFVAMVVLVALSYGAQLLRRQAQLHAPLPVNQAGISLIMPSGFVHCSTAIRRCSTTSMQQQPYSADEVALEALWLQVPQLAGCSAYSSSLLPLAWRQNESVTQLWFPLAEGERIKSDVTVALTTRALSLRIRERVLLDHFALPHKVDVEDSTWYSDEGTEGSRWLVIELAKVSDADWDLDGPGDALLSSEAKTVQTPLAAVSYQPAAYIAAGVPLGDDASLRASALKNAAAYKYGMSINLDYPGLQVIFESPVSGAPFFIIPQFLSDDECDRFVRRCSGVFPVHMFTPSDRRSSSHVNIVKEETRGFQARVAKLTNRQVENMENVKFIHYKKGEQFALHMDASRAASGSFTDSGLTSLDGRSLPDYVNREMTLFVYLNTATNGGETAFFGPMFRGDIRGRPTNERDFEEIFRIQPTKGLAVLFYTSLQPPSGQFPPDLSAYDIPFIEYQKSVQDYYFAHAGLPAIDEKYILAQWIWPLTVNNDTLAIGVDNTPQATGRSIM